MPAIRRGLPYRSLIEHACWLSYEIGLVDSKGAATYPYAVRDFADQVRQPGSLQKSGLARPWKRYFRQMFRASDKASTPSELGVILESIEQPTASNTLEKFLVEIFPDFAISSAQVADDVVHEYGFTEVDWDEFFEEDVKGAVIGALAGFAMIGIGAAAGAAAGGAAGGPAGAGEGAVVGGAAGAVVGWKATASGALVGGILSSGIEYLQQDAVHDALKEGQTIPSDGGNPWLQGDGDGGSGAGRWHDGDGYGFG